MQTLVFLLLLCGSVLLLYRPMTFKKTEKTKRPKGKETVKDVINRIEGIRKVSFLKRSITEAKGVLEKTDNASRIGGLMKTALLSSVAGVLVGLFLKNILLAAALGGGLYFIPLWLTQFSLYAYTKVVNEELEVALSLITSSYVRCNDIIKSMEENVEHLNYPIKNTIEEFLQRVRYVNGNVSAELHLLKEQFDNKIFRLWCDNLILCQQDHTLKATLVPIVSRFSDMKTQQLENETNMLLPFRNMVKMTVLVVAIVPLLCMLSSLWFYSIAGQLLLAVTTIFIFISINAAIKLSSPIEYDV